MQRMKSSLVSDGGERMERVTMKKNDKRLGVVKGLEKGREGGEGEVSRRKKKKKRKKKENKIE